MKKYWRQIAGVLVGVAVTPLAIAASIASAGAGHGTYLAAKLLFPYTMLLSRLNGDTITHPFLGIAFVQFPVYGLVAASFGAKRTLGILFLLHVTCAGLCFSGLLPNFA